MIYNNTDNPDVLVPGGWVIYKESWIYNDNGVKKEVTISERVFIVGGLVKGGKLSVTTT